jgi:hypothetical protein
MTTRRSAEPRTTQWIYPPCAVAIMDPIAEPISYQNDFVGVLQKVYDYDDAARRIRIPKPSLSHGLFPVSMQTHPWLPAATPCCILGAPCTHSKAEADA